MNLLQDVITYIRRIIKSPSDSQITDALLIDYINRFWIMDVDARIQVFDLKTKYQFQTTPGVDRYNMPLYDVQIETQNPAQTIASYPVYQGFLEPVFVNGIPVSFHTQKNTFMGIWCNYTQNVIVGTGDGSVGPYNFQIPYAPNINNPINQLPSGILRGHIDITGIIAAINGIQPNQDPPLVDATDINVLAPFIQRIPVTSVDSSVFFIATGLDGANVTIQDSGQFIQTNQNYGLLMEKGNAPLGNLPLTNGPVPNYSLTQNTINYNTGVATNVYFPNPIAAGQNIYCQYSIINPGLPRSILFYNNTLTLRSVPDKQYLVELDAYLTPAAFLSTSNAIPFGYMAEYIARGAARKILSDTGDAEQFQFYEPFFQEQEILVWKRSQRIFTSTRSHTIYSNNNNGNGNNNGYGIGWF